MELIIWCKVSNKASDKNIPNFHIHKIKIYMSSTFKIYQSFEIR